MLNLMGKSPAAAGASSGGAAAEPVISVSMKDLKGSPLIEEPFVGLGFENEDSDEIETAVEIDEDFKFQPSTPEELAAVGAAAVDDELAVDVIEVRYYYYLISDL